MAITAPTPFAYYITHFPASRANDPTLFPAIDLRARCSTMSCRRLTRIVSCLLVVPDVQSSCVVHHFQARQFYADADS